MAEEKTETLSKLKNRHKNELRVFTKGLEMKIKKAKGKEKKELKKKKPEAEAEFKKKQQIELEEKFPPKNDENEGEEISSLQKAQDLLENSKSDPAPKKKITKAERRRRKKKQKEEEERRQAEEAQKNHIDLRGIEMRKILVKLGIGWKIQHIASDGHCMFRSVIDQLSLFGDTAYNHITLRKACRNFISDNEDIFLPFLVDDLGNQLDHDGFVAYLERLISTDVVMWGGEPELIALSRLLQRRIIIHKGTGSDLDVVPPGVEPDASPLRISYHLDYLISGEHYNSVIRVL